MTEWKDLGGCDKSRVSVVEGCVGDINNINNVADVPSANRSGDCSLSVPDRW
jgi:hypothetical protein